MPVGYSLEEFDEVTSKNKDKQTEFLSGRRKEGIDKLFQLRGKKKGLFIPIGLNMLKLTDIKKTTTKQGTLMYVLEFKKEEAREVINDKVYEYGWVSSFNNSTYPYLPIRCYHIINNNKSVDFKHSFYKTFTNNIAEKDLLKLKKGLLFKGVIKYVEEYWELGNGKRQKHDRGNNFGKDIVLVKPEIESIYHINTPDEEIELNYFKLYVPIK